MFEYLFYFWFAKTYERLSYNGKYVEFKSLPSNLRALTFTQALLDWRAGRVSYGLSSEQLIELQECYDWLGWIPNPYQR